MTEASFRLGGLRRTADYTFEDADSGTTWTIAGQTLAEKGLPFAILHPRSSRLVFYTAARKQRLGPR